MEHKGKQNFILVSNHLRKMESTDQTGFELPEKEWKICSLKDPGKEVRGLWRIYGKDVSCQTMDMTGFSTAQTLGDLLL